MKIRSLLLVAAMAGAAATVPAQPACSGPDEHLMSWPTVAPVWEFCWLRPADSSGSNGSGIEIRDVYYDDHLVMKRGHVPVVNVLYETGSCGGADHCYRDYTDVEWDMLTDNICPPPDSGTACGYAEPTCPPVTVCQQHQGVDVCPNPPTDCVRGCFRGVTAEKFADRLILTTETKAGWYRYEIKWTFYLDGRFQPSFGFSAVSEPCIRYEHRHHAYWRFDFDIDGAAVDKITETRRPDGRGGDVLSTEVMRLNDRSNLSWVVWDKTTRRGYILYPGEEQRMAADSFSVGDVWFLKYKPEELDDTGQSGPSCAIKVGNFINGEPLDDDVVVWYRGGVIHKALDLDHCHTVGPTFVPTGWSP